MVITKIAELRQGERNQAIGLRQLKGRPCLYDVRVECTAPKLQLEICRTCPRAASYIRKNIVRSLFERIKAMAIMMLNTVNVQLSK